jgi:ABC-type glycerol-3-phosphate transport system permease component
MKDKKQAAAVLLMLLISIPLLLVYGSFFKMAFQDNQGSFTLNNFEFLFKSITLKQTVVQPIINPLKNTVLFTVIVTISEVLLSSMAGYAISRMDFKGKRIIIITILILRIFPGILLLIGILYVLINLGIINSLTGVILVAVALRLPGSTYIIKGFFDNISRDVENAAMVDGCTKLSAFFQVIIHMVKPGLASISIFAFMSSWSNYILFNTLIFNTKTPVLATYLRNLSRADSMIADYGVFGAIAVIYMLPILVFFFVSQKQLMKANMSGGKGL